MIAKLLAKERQASIQIASDFLDRVHHQHNHLNPVMNRMLKEIKTYTLRGGKWVRPWLARAGVRLLNKNVTSSIYQASLALELMHRYILIHDDIIDQDFIRHDGPTIQKIFKTYHQKHFPSIPDNTDSLGHAIIAGDILSTLTDMLFVESGLSLNRIVNIKRCLSQDFIDTAAGWMYETHLKQKRISEVREVEVITTMKQVSAHYSVLWPLRIGQVLAGKPYGEWIPEIEDYGTNIGLAFQIQDDILAIFGNQKETGKPVGNDIREGKKTLLIVYAYQHGSSRERDILENSLHQTITTRRLNQIKHIFEHTGALEYTQKTAATFMKKGISAVSRMRAVNDEARNQLLELAEYLVNRAV